MRRRLVVATRIAGELGQALIEEDIDVEGTRDTVAIGAVDGVGRVHRFDHEAIAHAHPLIGWLELRAKVADAAITAAHAIKVRQQRASMLVVQRSISCARALIGWMQLGVTELDRMRRMGAFDHIPCAGGGRGGAGLRGRAGAGLRDQPSAPTVVGSARGLRAGGKRHSSRQWP